MTKFKRHHKRHDLVPWGAILLVLALSPVLWAEGGGKSMTIDEMLEYTIQDLNARMQGLVEENTRLSARNNALRSRILLLREQSRQTEDQRIRLMEEYLDISENSRLDAKGYFLSEGKEKTSRQRVKQLKEQQGGIQARIDEELRRQTVVQKRIDALETGIKKVRKETERQSPTPYPEVYRQQREGLRGLIEESQRRVRQGGPQRNALRQKIVALGRKKEVCLSDHRNLQQRRNAIRKELQGEKDRGRLMERDVLRKEQKRRVSERTAREEIQQLGLYRDQLEEAIQRLQDAQRQITAESRGHRQEMADSSRLLDKQNGLLGRQAQVLSDFGRLGEDLCDRIRQGTILLETKRALEDKKEGLRQERQRIVRGTAGQKERQEELRKALNSTRAEITGLRKEWDSRQQRIHADQKTSLNNQEREMRRSLQDQERKVAGLHRERVVMTGKTEGLSRQWTSLKNEGRLRQQDIQLIKEELQAQGEEQADLKDQAQKIRSDRGQGAEGVRQEIEALQLRQALLSNSLPVIQSRYDADQIEVQAFAGEEQQIQEYRAILQQENDALRDKARTLNSAVEKLEGQKKAPPAAPTDTAGVAPPAGIPAQGEDGGASNSEE